MYMVAIMSMLSSRMLGVPVPSGRPAETRLTAEETLTMAESMSVPLASWSCTMQ